MNGKEERKERAKVFGGLRVRFVSGRGQERLRHEHLKRQVELYGGQTTTEEAAHVAISSIPVETAQVTVSPQWVVDCIGFQQLVDTKNYQVRSEEKVVQPKPQSDDSFSDSDDGAASVSTVRYPSSEEESSTDLDDEENNMLQPRQRDNYLISAAREIAATVSAGAMRRPPPTTDGARSLVNSIMKAAMAHPALHTRAEGAKRFCVYMTYCFVTGRRGTRMLPKRRIARLKRLVRTSWFYQRLMDA